MCDVGMLTTRLNACPWPWKVCIEICFSWEEYLGSSLLWGNLAAGISLPQPFPVSVSRARHPGPAAGRTSAGKSVLTCMLWASEQSPAGLIWGVFLLLSVVQTGPAVQMGKGTWEKGTQPQIRGYQGLVIGLCALFPGSRQPH